MKGLGTLIKFHQRNLDALRRSMAALELQKAQLQAQTLAVDAELRQEMQLAGNTPEMAHFFGDFAQRIRARKEQILQEIHKLDQQIARLNLEITDAFAELKKFEIARDNEKLRLAAAEARQETAMLDEIAARQHQVKPQ